MGVVTGARSLKSALRNLEAEVADRQRSCAHCLYQRETWPLPKGRSDESYEAAVMRCEFCLAKLTLGLPAELPLHSYIMREKFSHTCEHLYTNKAVHAFWVWSSHMMALYTIQQNPSGGARSVQKPRRNHMRERLEGESDRLLVRRHKRLRAKYGEPFPEHALIVNSVVNRGAGRASQHLHAEAFKTLYEQETHRLVCAEMEKIIWGQVRQETESYIAELRREMDRLIAGDEDRPCPKAEDTKLRGEEEAESRARAGEVRERGAQTADNPSMKGMTAFDWDAHERQDTANSDVRPGAHRH